MELRKFFLLFISFSIIGYLLVRKTNSNNNSYKKFNNGDCIRHKDADYDHPDFIVSRLDGEKYKLITYKDNEPEFILEENPPYSLKNYIENFFEKVKCNYSPQAYNKDIVRGKDQFYSFRILKMRQDLDINFQNKK